MEHMERHLKMTSSRQPVGQPSGALGGSDRRGSLEGSGSAPAHFSNLFKGIFSKPQWPTYIKPDEQAGLHTTHQQDNHYTTYQPAVPQTANQPAVPQTANQHAVPQAANQPAVPQTTNQPAVPQTRTQGNWPVRRNELGGKSPFFDDSSFSPRGSFLPGLSIDGAAAGPPSRLSTPKYLQPGSTSSRTAGSPAASTSDDQDRLAAEVQRACDWTTGYDLPATIPNMMSLSEFINALELLQARLITQYQDANRAVAHELRMQAVRRLEGYQLSPTRQRHLEELKQTRKGFLDLRSSLNDAILKASVYFYKMYEDLDPAGEL
ncbi:hypothetical protein F4680DRAFT_340296 [Xylaria scruposa]|nr:hypothetical protein F4680DRAFT_340296 [Xylaria scruposa]